jgi:hypothetical protein
MTVFSAALSLFFASASLAQSPTVAPAYVGKLALEAAGGINGAPAQMVWGPDRRLYVMTTNNGVHSFAYNAATGALSDEKVVVPNVGGIGIAFHLNSKGQYNLYLTVFDGNFTDAIVKLGDENHNGIWGEAGETNVKIVKGIPIGDHDIDQLIVKGDTLFVGIGRRTINGHKGDFTMGSHSDAPNDNGFWAGDNGFSWGDCSYNGIIGWIKNLNAVVDTENSANAFTDTTVTQSFIQDDASPYTILTTLPPATLDGKLLVHSAGTRNPFGFCLDKNGELWFTNNFNRTMTNGDGTSGFGYLRDSLGPDFSKDVQDQLFHAKEGADYGYSDANWRGKSPLLPATPNGSNRVLSTTFDNLFNNGPYVIHDPANPDGLGPSASADGCGFFYAAGLPTELQDHIVIARDNGSITETGGLGRTLTYSDVVAVDTKTGKVRRVAQGFVNPLVVLWDGAQRLIVADYGDEKIYTLRPTVRRVSVSAVLSKVSGGTQAKVTVTNTGDFPVSSVTLRRVDLSGSQTTTSLPATLGNIAVGGSSSATLSFPKTFASGTSLFLTVSGAYTTGTFSTWLRVTAP